MVIGFPGMGSLSVSGAPAEGTGFDGGSSGGGCSDESESWCVGDDECFGVDVDDADW